MMSGRRSDQRGRRHATTACSECRIIKLKCHGEQPQCARCKSRNKECSYRSHEDKKRIPHQRKVEVLRARVIQLESFIASSGFLALEVRDDDYDLLNKVHWRGTMGRYHNGAPEAESSRDYRLRYKSMT